MGPPMLFKSCPDSSLLLLILPTLVGEERVEGGVALVVANRPSRPRRQQHHNAPVFVSVGGFGGVVERCRVVLCCLGGVTFHLQQQGHDAGAASLGGNVHQIQPRRCLLPPPVDAMLEQQGARALHVVLVDRLAQRHVRLLADSEGCGVIGARLAYAKASLQKLFEVHCARAVGVDLLHDDFNGLLRDIPAKRG
eukprot:CAMPEP_0181347320 /NCGR_PEP_ID=MMETSP1101-20121128/33817_1 /TAXON_ID=46948 /ORGANISM="Rhodomonas abbreviata, Strain Caron Lab Isolate" /LENGTH=193 /DNA_ID=CAMNT_0023459529 /DNA_START=88 /DNA_END=669 /DNA_ORIENTATION=+